jgi:hypothetical protein
MDPLPSINKIFSMVVQEERQREITSTFFAPLAHTPVAMTTKYTSLAAVVPKYAPKYALPAAMACKYAPPSSLRYHFSNTQYSHKERPICTHCGLLGHTIERCYMLHGYSPGYNFTKENNAAYIPSTNMVYDSPMPQLPITSKQCQQLLTLLRSKCPDDISIYPSAHASVITSVTPTENQDHLFTEMAGNAHHSFCLQFSTLGDKHYVFSSNHIFQMTLKTSVDHPWIIDTRATNHMVCLISFLTTINSIVDKHVRLLNGNLAAVTDIGTAKLSTILTLTNVLWVPSFLFNLIFVSKLISVLHYCLIFLAEFCFILQLLGWKIIGMGGEKGGLYHLILRNLGDFCDLNVPVLIFPSAQTRPPFNVEVSAFTQIKPHFNSIVSDSFVVNSVNSIVEVSANVWHSRLGHLSDSKIHLLNDVLPGCSSIYNKDCFVCPLAKQHIISFPISNTHFAHIFDLIHCDIWDPFFVTFFQ